MFGNTYVWLDLKVKDTLPFMIPLFLSFVEEVLNKSICIIHVWAELLNRSLCFIHAWAELLNSACMRHRFNSICERGETSL